MSWPLASLSLLPLLKPRPPRYGSLSLPVLRADSRHVTRASTLNGNHNICHMSPHIHMSRYNIRIMC